MLVVEDGIFIGFIASYEENNLDDAEQDDDNEENRHHDGGYGYFLIVENHHEDIGKQDSKGDGKDDDFCQEETLFKASPFGYDCLVHARFLLG